MKKILFFASALAALLLAASCQRESLEPEVSCNVVSYTIQVPGALSTKVIGENVSAVNELVYEVYRTEATAADDYTQTETKLFQKTAVITDGKATVDFELVNNQNFRVLFWAHVNTQENPSVYTTTDLKNVTLSQSLTANAERYAAFAGSDFIKYGDNIKGRTVTLVRPIAQLNIATAPGSLDLEGQTTVKMTTTGVTVTGLSTSYNVAEALAGDVATTPFTYTAAAVSGLSEQTLSVNGTAYNYVAMNYVGFAEQSGSNVEVSYTINTENVGTISNTIKNVPVKANYRTNIIGNLITSMSDYTITLDAEWGETEYVGPEFVEQPAYNADTHTWTVTNADQLAWVAASVNGTIGVQTKAGATTKNFKGETVLLANDIDLEGKLWTPIGTVLGQSRYDYLFAGTFDGNGKTIYNLKVNHADCAGLFGNMCTATVKDLTINGFDLKADHYAGAIVGWVEQGASEVLIENCKAINGNIQINVVEIEGGKHDLGDKAGAIVGFSHHGKYIDNEVENVIIEGYRDLGGIVGYGNNSVVTGNSIVDVTLVQNLTIDYKKDEEENGSTPTTVKDYVGREGGTCTIVGNTGEANIVKAIASGVYASKTEIDAEENGVITEYSIYASEGLEWLAESVTDENSFDGVTVKLTNDIELPEDKNWEPIGDNRTDAAFKGTFDGDNHTIKGAKITGSHCWDGSVYGSKEGWGLFSVVDEAEIKNLNIDDAVFASYTVISGAVAGYAYDTTFENITINNTKISGYNWYTGGVVGWAGGNCTFKGIDLDSTTSVGTLWDSHGQCAGGIAGGISSSATITIEDCNIACVLDVINDVTSNYKWWVYRVSGMIIGNISTTQTIDGREYPDPSNVTCQNVTVTYGDWMNYHYCQGYWNRGWGRVESSDYVDGIDHTQCNHPDGEAHYVCVPFNQLFGGGPNGDGRHPVYGLEEYPGVTVKYPASYVRGVATLADITRAKELGIKQIILEDGIDCSTTQLALDGISVDLNGHELKTNMTYGGMSLKNGASIKNGTIVHTSTVAAIKAFNVESIENVTIKTTCDTPNKTITAIAVQQGGHVGTIKNVTIEGVSQGIEVGYQATIDNIEGVTAEMNTNGTAEGIGLVINGGMVGLAKDCTFKGSMYGVKMLLKGVFDAGLELQNCIAEGTTASISAYDEKGISNTSGSLTLTYDAATTLNGPFLWDFEDECKSVVTLNKPE